MKSFTPGDIIYKKDTTLFLLVLAVTPPVPSCGEGAFITFLPFGENKPLGPVFTTPTHWLSLLEPNR